MDVITYIMLAFAALAALDRIAGNRLGLGDQLERGIHMLGPLTVSMAGILVLAPPAAGLLEGAAAGFPEMLDFSIVPASLFGIDMGGAPLAVSLAGDELLGGFNGIVVSSMMGVTVSFTLPYALSVTDKKYHQSVIFGMLCGIVTIPIGCVIAGLAAGIPPLSLILNLVPLILFAGVIAFGILRFEAVTVKIFNLLGWLIKSVITVGFVVGITEFLTGYALIPGIQPFGESMDIIVNIMCIMAGAFPLLYTVRCLLSGVLKKFAGLLGINEDAVFGFVSTLGTSITTFEAVPRMDDKGIVLNSAFAVSAAFVFVDHLAFAMTFDAEWIPYMIIGKLVSGIFALILANLLYSRRKQAIEI